MLSHPKLYSAWFARRQQASVQLHGSPKKSQRKNAVCRAGKVSGEAYEDIIDTLARRAIARAEAARSAGPPTTPEPSTSSTGNCGSGRVLVGVAGSPGSGKSTLATAVAARINELRSADRQLPYAVVLPMDGFHYYRRELDAMPNPKEAHARRGAPWTFNAAKFVEAVRRVRRAGAGGGGGGGEGCGQPEAEAEAVLVPSFDHGVGDPVEEDIVIPAGTVVVLVEGNYVLLEEPPWSQLAELLDEAWFVDCPVDLAMRRVFNRQTAIGLAPEVSRIRIATNDRPNAELVVASAHRATLLVPSTVPFRGARQ